MSYYGDVFDSPPLWLRIVLLLACIGAGGLMIGYLGSGGHAVLIIITTGALALAVFLVASLETAAQLAFTTMGFWAFLAALLMFLP